MTDNHYIWTHVQTLAQKNPTLAQLAPLIEHFCDEYENAVLRNSMSVNKHWPIMKTFLSLIEAQIHSPYAFQPYHKQVCTPFDYYAFGLDFVRPLVDFTYSQVLGKHNLENIASKIAQKENVILLSNHQTEIDPQVISLLIEKEYPALAKEMIFMAGHRVTQDPMAVPFSLGRNLLCIYSKRHMDHPPEKKAEKLAHNQKTMKAMQELLEIGGACIYVAPSGGRDRKNEHNEVTVAPFDPQSIEMLYLISSQVSKKTSFHPLALRTYEILPPPSNVEKNLGEVRHAQFSPAFLYFGESLDMENIADLNITDKKERRKARAEFIWKLTCSMYEKLASLYEQAMR